MSHFYDIYGNSVFYVEKRDGCGMRPTTVADAKKLGLLPSVTTILKILKDESFFDKPHVQESMRLGRVIHNEIEKRINGLEYDCAYKKYTDIANDFINNISQKGCSFSLEKPSVNEVDRFAGTVDCTYLTVGLTHVGVIDWKTTKTYPKIAIRKYLTYELQAAAYTVSEHGIGSIKDGLAKSYVVYLSTSEPGRFEVVELDSKRLLKLWHIFKKLSDVYFFLNSWEIDV